MKTLLVIDSSARLTRSITRRLTQRAAANWLRLHPSGTVHHVDLGRTPPPAIDEPWIAAAYTPPPRRTPEMVAALRASDAYVDPLLAADAIVIGAPLYNFGMPAQLKAYIEQVVRVGRTFEFNRGGREPYTGLVGNKPTLVATSSGATQVVSGGTGYDATHLEPQLLTVLRVMGIHDVTVVALRGQQQDATHIAHALDAAEREIDAWPPASVSPGCDRSQPGPDHAAPSVGRT